MEEIVDVPVLPELPSEIICSEILPRLPAKSLMRFRCVSKFWYSLTRNPSFVASHRHHNTATNKNILLFLRDKAGGHQRLLSLQIDLNNPTHSATATNLLTLPPAPDTHPYNIQRKIQRVNGLICLNYHYKAHPEDPHRDRDPFIYVLNPTTRELLTLPQPSSPTNHQVFMSHYFGFSPLTNEYKILQVVSYLPLHTNGTIIFNVLTLATASSTGNISTIDHEWRRSEVTLDHLPFPPIHDVDLYTNTTSLCVHGAIHWRCGYKHLFVFDVAKERFRTILVPQDIFIGKIVQVDGCVSLIRVHHLSQTMHIWILKDYENEKWVMETIALPCQWKNLGRPFYWYWWSTHPGDKVVVLKLGTSEHGIRVYLYNMNSRSFTTSDIILPEAIVVRDGDDGILQALVSYEESIFPLK